jgi:hypothetical protein
MKAGTSVLGTKRQFARCKAMSGVGGKAERAWKRRHFRFLTQ